MKQITLRFLALLSGQLSAAPGRPNIILIMADDLGYTDVGAFGTG